MGSHAERVHKSIKKNSLVLVTDNVRTLKRDEAEVSQTDDGDLLFRIEYRVAQDLHPIVRGLKKSRP